MKILIAGFGFVGEAMLKLFPDADVYDPYRKHIPEGVKVLKEPPEERYDFCFICAPTPMNKDGSCDTSCVSDIIQKIEADTFIVRSTIAPRTTASLGYNVVFQPEYVASSSPYPAPLADEKTRNFIILGGFPHFVKKVRRLYENVYPPTTKYLECFALEAEIIKYMENCFIATYVTFCNEFYDICKRFGADYDVVREGFLLDPRMTPWWTYVYPNKRGWGGHCLGKDTAALVHACQKEKYDAKLINSVIGINETQKNENKI